MMFRFGRIAFCAMLVAGCVTGGAQSPSGEDNGLGLAERFERIAFYEEGSRSPQPLQKWAGPITYGYVGDSADPDQIAAIDQWAPLIDRQFAELTALSGIPAAENYDTPAVTIVLGDKDFVWGQLRDFQQQEGGTVVYPYTCSAMTFADPRNHEIFSAAVFLRVDIDPAEIPGCIAQELTQIMGLTNDIDADDTQFSSWSELDGLTEADKRLLSILYNSRLRPGMTRSEAMPIVREIIAERGW